MRRLCLLVCLSVLVGCDADPVAMDQTASSPQGAAPSTPVLLAETASEHGVVRVERLVTGLVNPWSLVFLPDGSALISERPGRLRRWSAHGGLSTPLRNVPDVVAEGQGGLLDVAISPSFVDDGLIFFSYAEAGEGNLAGTAVARGRLSGDQLIDVQVIFRQQPKVVTRHHFGSRLVFDGDGNLFITLGERGQRIEAQNLASHLGKLIRIHADGSVPNDNPFVSRSDALPEIWSYGHRNMQGAAISPYSGRLWTAEHGPKGGDELNRPEAGKNYGWPIITYGIDYSGDEIPEAIGPAKDGMEQPHHYWPVSPAISGMAFYDDARFPAWRHSLFVGSLVQRGLIRLSLRGEAVVAEERLLENLGWRIRDVRVGPDGALYVLTDEADGQLLRISLVGLPH
ncbi:MAG: PQQ-dependent sugar dehydrogenase [Lysobacteraceae bacterium]